MKDILVMPIGRESRFSQWMLDPTRTFDIIFLAYHDPSTIPWLSLDSKEYTVRDLRGFKWHMVHDLFEHEPQLLSAYRFFFFVDDDIAIDKSAIDELFFLMDRYSLMMSQPVLTRNSYKSWRTLRKQFCSGVRYLSTVELMCPVLHRSAILELRNTFNLNNSGWGLDILWGDIIRKKFGDRSIAVFDLVKAHHTKPVGRGELYQKLGKSAFEERDEIFARYSLADTIIFELPIPENSLWSKYKSFRAIQRLLRNRLSS